MIGESGTRKEQSEGVRERNARARRAAFRYRPTAFTLVELLVAVAIITILSTMLLGASSLAMESARQSRTEALIAKLHGLLSQHYDTLRYRRVELKQLTPQQQTWVNANPKLLQSYRLQATYELLRLETPDRWSDITFNPIAPSPSATVVNAPNYLAERTTMSMLYLRRFNRIVANSPDRSALIENQGAECLYLVITMATGDGESSTLFKENEVADTDGDGAPEFVDAWGRPIQFLRWAPGFDSDAQISYPGLERVYRDAESNSSGSGGTRVMEALINNHDPVDLFLLNDLAKTQSFSSLNDIQAARGFRLAPLIYSAGSDGEFGIEDGGKFSGDSPSDSVKARDPNSYGLGFVVDLTPNPPLGNATDPYLRIQSTGQYLGESTSGVATDNIHNHLIEGR